ncbi:MAG TPA: YceI family protein [Thermoanaerobaculia bacterium]|nr:YceI family protein [Thermoanaerobaculia bacterium]
MNARLSSARLAAAIALLLVPFAAVTEAAPVVYLIDSTHSTVEFSISKWTVTRQTGLFRTLDGKIRMDPARPETAEVVVRIDASSLDTRNGGRDRVVRSDDFLDVAKHPHMIFRSTGVRRNGSSAFEVAGDLTIRGVTRRIVAPVRLAGLQKVPGVGELASFETEFVVNRRDFGVLGTRWSGGKAILGDEVTVTLAIVARRAR